MSGANPRRARYVVFVVVTIVAGLVVNKLGGALPHALRDILGDALWAAMMFWIVSAIAPTARLWMRAGAAIAIAFGVEYSQMYHAGGIDALRNTTLGHLVLGSDFDARDLVAYALGVATAAVVDAAATPATAAASKL